MGYPTLGHPLPDDTLIELAQQRWRMADRQGATDADQASLRDVVPALLHRLRDKLEMTRDVADIPVLDLRFCGVEVADDQIELALPQPE